tara:strand:+ start:5982 stop:6872 length:891 start_codon:yes stop_codon:yes gene_type:complete
MTAVDALRIQTYSNSLDTLSQELGAKLSVHSMMETAGGSKSHRMTSQIGVFEASERSARLEDVDETAIPFDGRWCGYKIIHHATYRDEIDLFQTNLDPTSGIVRGQVNAINRKCDKDWLTAFFGTAQTGETGSTSTTFDSGNVVAVTVGGGGSATGLNVEKLRAGKLALGENSVDIDSEPVFMGISSKQHDNLLGLTQVVSTDFNNRPVLVEGMVRQFLGINFIVSEIFALDGTSYERCPMWVASGMGAAQWQAMKGDIRRDPRKKGEVYIIEAQKAIGYTRLEEAKCIEVKCTRS